MENFKLFLNTFFPIQQKTWNELMPLFRIKELKKGDYFIREDQKAKEWAFLNSGVVRAFYTNQKDREYTKRFFTSPSIIGSYSSLLTEKPSLYSQQALTNCTIFVANYKQVLKLYDAYLDLERLARKFAENYFVFNELKELEVVLLDATERYFQFKKEYPDLEQLIPQYHIASYLGISPTQLSRIRKIILNK
ncbi:MAG: Crp/Fnr family transcriptional regulator [Ferruginibacter sp.]